MATKKKSVLKKKAFENSFSEKLENEASSRKQLVKKSEQFLWVVAILVGFLTLVLVSANSFMVRSVSQQSTSLLPNVYEMTSDSDAIETKTKRAEEFIFSDDM